jgi:DNA-binding NarL/FixJ family response regulator
MPGCAQLELGSGVDLIRVHLGPMPEMLRMIIGDLLSRETDIVIAGQSTRHADCLREARGERADIVIAQDLRHDGANCLDLILGEPPLGILAVAADGQSAAGVSLTRKAIALRTGSPSILAEAIRRMAADLHPATIAKRTRAASGTGSET